MMKQIRLEKRRKIVAKIWFVIDFYISKVGGFQVSWAYYFK